MQSRQGGYQPKRLAWQTLVWLETFVALLMGAVLVHCHLLRWVIRGFGSMQAVDADTLNHGDDTYRARLIGQRVTRIGNRLPWQSSCLVRAVALGLLLARRRIGGWCIRIGVCKKDKALAAHAWLLMGKTVLIGGGDAMEGYRPLADFVAFRGI